MKKKELHQMNKKEIEKEFSNSLTFLARSENMYKVFENFLDYSIFIFNSAPSEEEVNQFNGFSDEEKESYLYMFQCYGELAEGFHDPLGDIFMEHLSSNYKGQFFTPECICDMMAAISGGYKEGNSVCDPCCGSGRNLLAVAKIARPDKINLSYHAADIDLICIKMTLLNFLVNTMTGEIAWMNTLSLEHWRSYHISTILHEGHYIALFRTTGPGETSFTLRYQNSIKEKKVIANTQEVQTPSGIVQMESDGQFLLF